MWIHFNLVSSPDSSSWNYFDSVDDDQHWEKDRGAQPWSFSWSSQQFPKQSTLILVFDKMCGQIGGTVLQWWFHAYVGGCFHKVVLGDYYCSAHAMVSLKALSHPPCCLASSWNICGRSSRVLECGLIVTLMIPYSVSPFYCIFTEFRQNTSSAKFVNLL